MFLQRGLLISTFIILSSFLVISPSMGLFQSDMRISSYGEITYPLGTGKTVTWADGTTETIEVTDDGRIYINGVRVFALGFIITTTHEEVTEVAANMMLDRLQADGIRFIAVGGAYWKDYDWFRRQIEFWYPKFYAHKMWVMLQIHRTNIYELIDVDGQFEKHSYVIDYVSANDLWAEMTFAVTTFWEYDYVAYIQGFTNEQVETFCSQMYPLLKNKLASSKIGSVPIAAKLVNSAPGWYGTTGMATYCDIPGWDRYSRVDINGIVDHSIEDPEFERWHTELLPAAGKEGMQVWFTESGSRLITGSDQTHRPESLKLHLNCNGWNDSSLAMCWELTSSDPNWAYFNNDGTPKQCYLDIAPYFPKVG